MSTKSRASVIGFFCGFFVISACNKKMEVIKDDSLARVVELVDTQDSGSCARKGVLVRV